MIVNKSQKYFDKIGLNSLKYKLVDIKIRPLYTKFIVFYNQKEIEEVMHTQEWKEIPNQDD